jgi:hypothetical protein
MGFPKKYRFLECKFSCVTEQCVVKAIINKAMFNTDFRAVLQPKIVDIICISQKLYAGEQKENAGK